tara:strand:- start:649 stop:1530 length:882 start_codon:yes stop_codon:yes gene_type:complete
MNKNNIDLGKYVISAFLLLSGSVSVVKFLLGDALESQPWGMFFAGLALIFVGVIALPSVLDKINTKDYKWLLVVGVLGSLGLSLSVVMSVNEEIVFQETKVQVQAQTIQRLKDIRESQLSHKSIYGTYALDFDSLKSFIKAVVVPVTYNMGSFHDTLPERKSFENGYVIKRLDLDSISSIIGVTQLQLLSDIEEDNSPFKIRDTTYTSFFAENFTQEERISSKLPLFKMNEMPFNPLTGERFIMKVGIVEVGGLWQPTLLVQDPTPFGREKVKKDTLSFGSISEAHTDGNWRN